MNRLFQAALCVVAFSVALSTAALADTIVAVVDIWSDVAPYIVAAIGAVSGRLSKIEAGMTAMQGEPRSWSMC